MNLVIRIILFIFSALTLVYVIRKIRKSQLLVWDAVYWICVSIIILSMALFPGLYTILANMIGIKSGVTFIFLIVIFLLLLKCFLLNLRISNIEYRFKQFVEEYAVNEKLK